jgi:dimethylhistidine N-methyltransferase
MRSLAKEVNHFLNVEIVSDDHHQFLSDTLKGLHSSPKHLNSKYFYDKKGDALFQAIMNSPEYYLTKCETEIFSRQTDALVDNILSGNAASFDLIEMGVGDGIKSRYLLTALLDRNIQFNYLPIDISGNVLSQLKDNLSGLTDLNFTALEGEYIDMLAEASRRSGKRKVILILGANIGNMSVGDTQKFCQKIRSLLHPGDIMINGFDLKKNPQIILDAYNDRQGLTKDFNLNLLHRINNELGADFDVSRFRHYQMYDPHSGSCKSYLVSKISQRVRLAETVIEFNEGEWIFMEISQKYSVEDVEKLAVFSGFSIKDNIPDSKKWFVDSIWVAQ